MLKKLCLSLYLISFAASVSATEMKDSIDYEMDRVNAEKLNAQKAKQLQRENNENSSQCSSEDAENSSLCNSNQDDERNQ